MESLYATTGPRYDSWVNHGTPEPDETYIWDIPSRMIQQAVSISLRREEEMPIYIPNFAFDPPGNPEPHYEVVLANDMIVRAA